MGFVRRFINKIKNRDKKTDEIVDNVKKENENQEHIYGVVALDLFEKSKKKIDSYERYISKGGCNFQLNPDKLSNISNSNNTKTSDFSRNDNWDKKMEECFGESRKNNHFSQNNSRNKDKNPTNQHYMDNRTDSRVSAEPWSPQKELEQNTYDQDRHARIYVNTDAERYMKKSVENMTKSYTDF